ALGAGPAADVSWRARVVAADRRSHTGRPGGRGSHPRRRDQYSHHQVLGGLVEHAAPTGLGAAPGRIDDSSRHPRAADRHARCIHAVVLDAASGRHAQRDHTEARAYHDDDAGRRARGTLTMNLGPYAAFIVTAYGAAIAIVAGLVGWVGFDRRHLGRLLRALHPQGVAGRAGRAHGGEWGTGWKWGR